MLKAGDGSGGISGFVLHESEICPKLWHSRFEPHCLLQVICGGRVISHGLGMLRVGKHRIQAGGGWLLAESDQYSERGSGQQYQQQFGAMGHNSITSRISPQTGRLCPGTQL